MYFQLSIIFIFHIEFYAKDSESQKAALQFPYTDVIDGYIYYLQSEHKSMEPSQDAFMFSVNDGKNRSPVEMFNISIQVCMNTNYVLVSHHTILFASETNPLMILLHVQYLCQHMVSNSTSSMLVNKLFASHIQYQKKAWALGLQPMGFDQ